ncbi:MAG TPA: FAD-dependent oxidoreductase, partial [Candidatus Acidoferrales bacterium]|nr:FAD-dependent oxidoreductase [Candidatus Acidoferrales bacterium]
MASLQSYDAIVIGSGQAGTPLCQALAAAGMRTALIEKEHVGGTCVNEGCTPTKTMVASGRVAYLARRGADYGVNAGAIRISMERVRKRKRDIVKEFRGGNEASIAKQSGLDLIYGEAAFTGPKSIEVRLRDGGQRALTADRI